MESLGDRLNHVLKLRGMGQSELARRLPLYASPQSIQYICSGKATQSVHTVGIARVLNVSADWLYDGTGQMELPAERTQMSKSVSLSIPLLEAKDLKSWITGIATSNDIESSQFYPTTTSCSAMAFAWKVQGESMEPEFVSDEVLIVDPEVSPVNGSFVLVSNAGYSDVKLKQLILNGPEKFLKLTNKSWPNPITELSSDQSIIGVVIESYRKR